MKKFRFLLGSLMTIMMCVCLIAGATFALFTSESETNIAVTSGKVKVIATAEIDKAWSAEWNGSQYVRNYDLEEIDNGYRFTNEGTVVFEDGTLTGTSITPGDGLKLNIDIVNFSTVQSKYRIEVTTESESALSKLLTVSYTNSKGEDVKFNGTNPRFTDWFKLDEVAEKDATKGVKLDTISVEIELPTSATKGQGESCSFAINVFAVQQNGTVGDPEPIVVTTNTKVSEYAEEEQLSNGAVMTMMQLDNVAVAETPVNTVYNQVDQSMDMTTSGDASKPTTLFIGVDKGYVIESVAVTQKAQAVAAAKIMAPAGSVMTQLVRSRASAAEYDGEEIVSGKTYFVSDDKKEGITLEVIGEAGSKVQITDITVAYRAVKETTPDVPVEPEPPVHEHEWDTENVVWQWAEDYTSATATLNCKGTDCEETLAGTVKVTSKSTDATCTKAGETVYTATATFKDVTGTFTTSETVTTSEATGHSYKATWSWADDYTSATATFTCEKGDYAETTKTTEKITSNVTKEASCTEEGKATYTATVEGPDGKTYPNTTEEVTLEKIAHELEDVAEVPATCEDAGNIEYWTCKVCHKNFNAQNEEVEDVTLNKLGHNWEGVQPTWAFDYDANTATATFECARECGHSETKVDEELEVATTPATCTEDGKTTYTASVEFEGATYTETKEVKINATGHAMHEVAETESTCTERGHVTYWTCDQEDGVYYKNEQGTDKFDSLEETLKELAAHNYENAEWKFVDETNHSRTCTTCEKETQTAEHTYNDNKWEYVDEDNHGIQCDSCEYVKKGTHNHVAIGDGKDATCEEVGQTKGDKCDVCGKVFEAQQDIPATNHANAKRTDEVAEECEKDGLKAYWYCADCETHFEDDNNARSAKIADFENWKKNNGKIDAFGHNYTYTDNGDGTHDGVCENNKEHTIENEAHTNGTEADCEKCDYVYVPESGEVWELVTSVEDLWEESTIIIVYETKDGYVSLGAQNGNYRDSTNGVTVTNGNVTVSETVLRITLKVGNGGENWALYIENEGYLYYSGSGNTLNNQTTLDAAASWKITITDSTKGTASIENVNTDGRYLQYNASQPRFACYLSSSNQQTPVIYKLRGSGIAPCDHEFTYEDNGNGTHTVTCLNECGYNKVENHENQYTNNGENHTVSCEKCEYSENKDHEYKYTPNGDTHTVSCEKCDYPETDKSHNWNDDHVCDECKVSDPDWEMVNNAIGDIQGHYDFEAESEDGSYQLAAPDYDGVTYKWEVVNVDGIEKNAIEISEDGELTFVGVKSEVVVTIKVTATYGDTSADKTFTLKIAPKPDVVEVPATITLTATNLNLGSSYAAGTATVDNISFAYYFMKNSAGEIQARQSSTASQNSYLYNTMAFSGRIVSIAITYGTTSSNASTQWDCYFGDSSMSTNPSSGVTTQKGNTGTLTFDAAADSNYSYFRLVRTGSGACYMSSIAITYVVTTSGSTGGNQGGGDTDSDKCTCEGDSEKCDCTNCECGSCNQGGGDSDNQETLSINLTATNLNLGSSYAAGTATVDNISFAYYFMKSSAGEIQARQSSTAGQNSYLYNTMAFSGRIVSIAITYGTTSSNASTQWDCYFGDSSMSTNPSSGATTQKGNTGTLTFDAAADSNYSYFRLVRTGSGACYISKIEINYIVTTSGSTGGNQGGGTTELTNPPVEPTNPSEATISLSGKGSGDANTAVWSGNGITVTIEKNTSGTGANNYDGSDHVRLYGGQKMTIEFAGMTKATISVNSGASNLVSYLQDAGYTVTVIGSTVTVTGGIKDGKIVFTNTVTSGNVQISSITVKA